MYVRTLGRGRPFAVDADVFDMLQKQKIISGTRFNGTGSDFLAAMEPVKRFVISRRAKAEPAKKKKACEIDVFIPTNEHAWRTRQRSFGACRFAGKLQEYGHKILADMDRKGLLELDLRRGGHRTAFTMSYCKAVRGRLEPCVDEDDRFLRHAVPVRVDTFKKRGGRRVYIMYCHAEEMRARGELRLVGPGRYSTALSFEQVIERFLNGRDT